MRYVIETELTPEQMSGASLLYDRDMIAHFEVVPDPADAKFYEITKDDVGRRSIVAFGKVWLTVDFIGTVIWRDVGKRVFRVKDASRNLDILQVENDDQFYRRMIKDGSSYERQSPRHHTHTFQGQTLKHQHEDGGTPHGYFEHPEDGAK